MKDYISGPPFWLILTKQCLDFQTSFTFQQKQEKALELVLKTKTKVINANP